MAKYKLFFMFLTALRSLSRSGRSNTRFKKTIGDSTNNNRTLTVNQLIRVLAKRDPFMSKEIEIVYGILRSRILQDRVKRGVNRTDAIDLSELTNTYRNVVMNKRQLRRQVGQALGRVSDGKR